MNAQFLIEYVHVYIVEQQTLSCFHCSKEVTSFPSAERQGPAALNSVSL